jgi:hypothetical protein
MAKTEAQKESQKKYQRGNPQAMVECKQRYRDNNVEAYKAYAKKSSAKYYMMTRNYKEIDSTMGGCIFKLFES